MADGTITIGVNVDEDKFDKQINELNKKIDKEENKKITIGAQLTGQERDLEKARQRVDELTDAYERMSSAQEAIEKRTATLNQFTDFFGMKDTYGSVEQLATNFDKAKDRQTALENKVEKTKIQYNEISQKVADYKQKIESIKLQKQATEVDKIKNGFKNVGNSLQDAVKKAGKLALGIFAIRSAYLAVRRASSDLASYDEQYATNLEYIRFVLTQAIAPVLRGIVTLVATIMKYIYAILNAWFGIGDKLNLSAENFRKMKSSAGGVSKAVKEIKKQLLGFDEINILTDQSDTGTSAGAGGVGTPGFDISDLEGEIPEWIMDNRDLILSILAGIAGGIVAIKLGLKRNKSIRNWSNNCRNSIFNRRYC